MAKNKLTNKEKFLGSLRNRLSREKGIAEKKKNKERAELMQKVTNTFTPDELYELGAIFAPSIGFDNERVAKANMVNLCSIESAEKMKRALRATIIEAVNIYSLSRKTKDFIIQSLVNGRTSDTGYYYSIGLAIEKINSDKKEKLKFNNQKIDFSKISGLIEDIRSSGGDFFKKIDDQLNGNDFEYFKTVTKFARKRNKNIEILLNSTLEEGVRNRTPIALNGFMSNYSSKTKLVGANMFAEDALSRAVIDLGFFIDANPIDMVNYSKIRLEEKEEEDKAIKMDKNGDNS